MSSPSDIKEMDTDIRFVEVVCDGTSTGYHRILPIYNRLTAMRSHTVYNKRPPPRS